MNESTVVSYVPLKINEYKPGVYPGRFIIKPSDGKNPILLHVGDSIFYRYVGDGKGDFGEYRENIQLTVPSDKMAKSIVDDFLDGQLGRVVGEAEPAIFSVPGKIELDTILLDKSGIRVKIEEALRKQKNWFIALVKLADDDWSKHHQHKQITTPQKLAAEILGFDRPWRLEVPIEKLQTIRCGVCRAEIIADAIICTNCKVILDPEKYKKYQFVGQSVGA